MTKWSEMVTLSNLNFSVRLIVKQTKISKKLGTGQSWNARMRVFLRTEKGVADQGFSTLENSTLFVR